MNQSEIHSVLIPANGIDVLLPNAAVAEMLEHERSDPIDGAVNWVLGTILWQGWQVPVIDYASLVEASSSPAPGTGRICVLKTLVDTERMPYMAIMTSGKPRLITVDEHSLEELPQESNPIAVLGHASIDGHQAVIPDLDRLGHLVAHAAFGALPLTS